MTTNNIFKTCDSIEEVVGQAVGAGSTCWENLEGTGVFQSTQAAFVAGEAVDRIRELIIGAKVALPPQS